MAVIQKTLFAKNLDRYSVLVNDTDPNSKYFKVTELPDTFTGGKNAFLVAGGSELVGDTKIQIELKDSNGNIIYHEPAEGLISSSINGENFVTEYYEGVSKVVSVYIYPDTAYGACTLTILGELSQYVDENGITQIVPVDWENKYNVKWQKSINVNPSLANTTKIRFYQRPQATITEILNPIYTIVSGSKVASAVTQSFADIKLSKLETFAGDVKRVKVFRTSEGDISDFDLIQDILVESKELLTSYGLSGSVIGQTGILTSETLKNHWNTGSLNAFLTSSRVESGVRLTGSGYFTYTSSLDIKSANTYELNLDAFYSASISSNLGIYLVSGSTSSSIATLNGTAPTKNLLDTIIPFKINTDYPTASLYFSQSRGEWHLGNISLKLSQDTAFSPDEISFVTTMPTDINNQTYNFKFEFYDVNNNYVPVAVTQSAVFTGGNAGATAKLLTFQTDRSAFRFSTGSYGNPANQTVKFSTQKTNLTGSVTYASSAFDIGGNYITPASYAGTYPGTLTNASDNGALLTIANFSGSVASVLIGSIVYTASCENFIEFETIYRFEDGDNAPGVFVTANTNQFIYKATDLSLNPAGQIITIEAKRKNLASAVTPLTVNSGSGKPGLTFVSTNATNGVDTYTISGTSYPYSTDETIYSISGSDQFGNVFSDAIKITPIKILDGFSIATSNENTSFPANSVGSVIGGFAASSGSITVKVGNEVISYASPIANNKFSASISATSGLTANTFNGTNYSINALSADSGSLTLLVKYQDGGGTQISSSKEITYSKVKKAAPVLSFVIGNNNQTTTAKSTGAQIDTFVTASFTVNETYDGVTTTKTFTPTSITTTNSYQTGSTTSATLALPNMADGTNSVDISITGSIVDSENTTRNVFGNISLSKAKKAVPNVVISATPQSQAVVANSTGTQTGTLSNVIISALEGTTSRFTSMVIVSTSGFSTLPTISSNTLTMTSAIMNTAEASVTLTITHTDSEGTTGQTQTITIRCTKVNIGTDGNNGSNGTNAKTVVITADNYVVTYDGNGSLSPGGQSVILTATSQNFTTPYYEFTKNGTIVRAYATTATYTIATLPSSGVSDLYQVNVKEGNVGSVIAFDNTDIFGVKAGTDSYTIFLTNEAHTLPAANDGTVSSYVGSGTSIIVYKGATELNGITSGTPTTGEFKVTSVVTTGTITIGAQTSAGNPVIIADHSAMTSDLATITYTINVENLVTITKLQSLSKSKKGDGGTNGIDGKRTATGMMHYQSSIASPGPSAPTATSYTFATNTFTGLTANWGLGAPTYASGNSNKYWYSTYTVVETTAGGGTGTPTFGSPIQAIGFSGLVSFTAPNNVGDGANTLSFGVAGATLINGSNISTGIIKSTNFDFGGADTDVSGSYMDAGTIFNLDTGSFRSKNFYISSTGDAFFKGTLSAAGGTFAGNLSAAGGTFSGALSGGTISIGTAPNIFKADSNGIYLGDATFANAPFRVTPAGALTATSATITGTITSTAGTIGGWSIGNTFLSSSNGKIIFNSATPEISYTGATYANFKLSTGLIDNMASNSESLKNTTYIGDGGMIFLGERDASNNLKNYIRIDNYGEYTRALFNSPIATTYTDEIVYIYKVTDANSAALRVGGGGIIIDSISSGANAGFVLQGSGDATFSGDVTANTSDGRLKTNIVNIDSPLEKISKINGVYFNWNELAKELTDKDTTKREVGFIAQEVQSVMPEIIKPAAFDIKLKTGENYLTIQYEKIVPLLVECIKELKKEIDELKNK